MPSSRLRIAYFAHTLRSDWNNGNAHFLRGLLRELGSIGHDVTAFEPASNWSITHLREEPAGAQSLARFAEAFPTLHIETYNEPMQASALRAALCGTDVVIMHEWNDPTLAHALLGLRDEVGFRLLFHDTHHRASSSPAAIHSFGTDRFDGVLAFGDALTQLYRDSFNIRRVWTLHEAADTQNFFPRMSASEAPTQDAPTQDIVWIGNWGEGERSAEIRRFLLDPAAALAPRSTSIYGVRYPADGQRALHDAGVRYAGYLPNLDAPDVYARSRITVHVPRQQYSAVMRGIPTIRVFEALACGIPLISAPWQDSERLFQDGDFAWAASTADMTERMQHLLDDEDAARAQATRGLATVLAHHTCRHRAQQLTSILEDVLR